jgi:hypothetical protein
VLISNKSVRAIVEANFGNFRASAHDIAVPIGIGIVEDSAVLINGAGFDI